MLYWKIKALLVDRGITDCDFLEDFHVIDRGDGAGPQLEDWNTAKLGATPTDAELNALGTQADQIKADEAAKENRVIQYPSPTDQLEAIWGVLDSLVNGATGETGAVAMLNEIQLIKGETGPTGP